MKYLKPAMLVALIATLTIAFGQATSAYLQFQRTDGTPTVQAEKGTVLADSSADTLWIKGGGNDTNNWTKFNFVPLKNTIAVSGTLASGVLNITNSAFTGSSSALVNATGTTAGGALSTSFSGTVLTIRSLSGSDARVVNGIVFGQ